MSTADNKRRVTVGIFVSLAAVIFVAGVFILAGKQKKFISTIQVKAQFDDVAGLRPGNNVWLSGVKIGTVKTISFSGNSQVEILMNIEESAQPFIKRDAQAKISSESLIGNKNVVIEGGSAQAPTVQDGDLLKSAKLLSTDDVMETLQENNKNLLAITHNFKTLSEKITRGEGPMGMLLTDSVLADNFRSVVSGLQKTSDHTAQASGALSQFTARLNNKSGLANQMLTDTVVFARLKSSVNELQKTTTSAAATTDNLKQATDKLDNSNNAMGVLLNDEKFASRLKSTMGNLETGTRKLDENMEALQHNFLLRGFFKKKDREKNKARQKAQEQEQQGQ
jgi:phospholipid/cholesterol/gamma-HCH transport system substrate-binding protein